MHKLLISLLFLAFISSVISLTEEQKSFISWSKFHRKTYSNNLEYKKRFEIYSTNLKYIESHNSKNLGFTLKMNKFGDLTNVEFAKLYLAPTIDTTRRVKSTKVYKSRLNNKDDDIDWRLKNVVTDVKNQGQCGSCWAFSTAASIESAWAIAMGNDNLYSLSSQQLMDCTLSYGNYGCNGGLIDPSFQYVIDNGGIDRWDAYPYEAESNFNCRYKNTSDAVGAYIDSFQDIKEGSEDDLQSAVMEIGPVSAAIDASHTSFQFYNSGVYYEPLCSSTQLSHGVNVVGFGSDTIGTQYYIVKNMWGTDWGMNGYVYMSRNMKNNCGLATMASFPEISDY